ILETIPKEIIQSNDPSSSNPLSNNLSSNDNGNSSNSSSSSSIPSSSSSNPSANQEIQTHLIIIDETLDLVEKCTLANTYKIFEEQLERECKDQEKADANKSTNIKLENL
ncbi:8910_t:CDS:2, partial [Ambispora leptoticha]